MPAPETLDVSIILSIHNEKLNLQPLVERIVSVMERYPHCWLWEIIMVDDASTDGSWEVMQRIQNQFPHYIVLKQHAERRGQKGCFMTGFETAHGTFSILMDADLQILPEELPRVLDKAFLQEAEIVCTYNDPERGGKNRGIVSAIGNIFMQILFSSPVRDAGANFMLIKTRYIRGVKLLANDQRYLLPISMRRGLEQIAEVGTIFGVRGYGKSKYKKWRKTLQGFPEMLQLKRRLLAGAYDSPLLPEEKILTFQQSRLLEATNLEIPDDASRDFKQAVSIARSDATRTWSIYENNHLTGLVSWQQLDWDSAVLERHAGRMDGIWADGNYAEQRNALIKLMNASIQDAGRQEIQFMSLRIPENDQATLHAAETVGFTVVESYLTYEHTLSSVSPADNRIRLATVDDMEVAGNIANRAFENHRFLIDPMLPEHLARQSRRDWVHNGFKGRADAIYVAEVDSIVCGFLLLKNRNYADNSAIGIIDLIAVDPNCKGQGLGAALIGQALHHYHGQASSVEVGTQAKNTLAVNLYARMGFQLKESALSLHWHRSS